MARPADPALRGKLLDAAREIFTEKGFAKASMSEIAQKAGVAHGTTYLYFKSKDALAIALADELNGKFLQLGLPALAQSDLKEGIRELVRSFFQFCQAERSTLYLLYIGLGIAKVQTLQSNAEDEKPDVAAMYINLLMERMERGEMRHYDDPQSLFLLLIGIFNWVALQAFALATLPPEALQSLELTIIQLLDNTLLP